MKKIEIILYSFDELSKEAQQKALAEHADINFTGEPWYDNLCKDAKNIGIEITSFDIDKNHCKAQFIDVSCRVADKIKQEHGQDSDTYKVAVKFIEDWDTLVAKYSTAPNRDKVDEENEAKFDTEATDLENNFLNDLQNEYLIMLRNEYEYRSGNEAIIETFKANEYTFEADGTMRNQ